MWEPVGPLPAAVYLRRRAVALAATVGAVLLVLTTVLLLPAAGAATTGSSASGSSVAPGTDGSGAEGGGSDAGIGSPVPTAAGTTASTGTERLQPDNTPRAAPIASPVAVPATGPVPCANSMIKVTAEVDTPDHHVGDHPVFRLVMVDSSPQPCVRDLDPARQEIVVWSGDGTQRLWSSNDCTNPGGPDLRTLVPQQPIVSAVTWGGRTTAPGCTQPRTPVPAGSYRVRTRLDNIISPPTPFLLLP